VRFLVDESCDFAVVRALRSAGFDVVAVAEVVPRALDEAVIELAVLEDRIVLTEDKDFGQLVYGSGRPSSGVILLRFPGRARSSIPEAVLRVVNEQGARLAGAFTIVQPGRLRIRRL